MKVYICVTKRASIPLAPCICERFIYFHVWSAEDPRRDYINRSHVYECRNWERGRAVSYLEIYVSCFRYSVLDVSYVTDEYMLVPGAQAASRRRL
jgi:hypothetical protein